MGRQAVGTTRAELDARLPVGTPIQACEDRIVQGRKNVIKTHGQILIVIQVESRHGRPQAPGYFRRDVSEIRLKYAPECGIIRRVLPQAVAVLPHDGHCGGQTATAAVNVAKAKAAPFGKSGGAKRRGFCHRLPPGLAHAGLCWRLRLGGVGRRSWRQLAGLARAGLWGRLRLGGVGRRSRRQLTAGLARAGLGWQLWLGLGRRFLVWRGGGGRSIIRPKRGAHHRR
jgi:hypothetical protein